MNHVGKKNTTVIDLDLRKDSITDAHWNKCCWFS